MIDGAAPSLGSSSCSSSSSMQRHSERASIVNNRKQATDPINVNAVHFFVIQSTMHNSLSYSVYTDRIVSIF